MICMKSSEFIVLANFLFYLYLRKFPYKGFSENPTVYVYFLILIEFLVNTSRRITLTLFNNKFGGHNIETFYRGSHLE